MASVACCTSLFPSTIAPRIIPGCSVVCLAVLQWNTKLHVLPGQRKGGGAWMKIANKKGKKKKPTLYKSVCNKISYESLCSPSSCSPELLGPQCPKYMRTRRHDLTLVSVGHDPENRWHNAQFVSDLASCLSCKSGMSDSHAARHCKVDTEHKQMLTSGHSAVETFFLPKK